MIRLNRDLELRIIGSSDTTSSNGVHHLVSSSRRSSQNSHAKLLRESAALSISNENSAIDDAIVPPPAADDDADFATDFVFPSREYRIRYYMGDWYNVTLQPGDVPCENILHNKLIIDESTVLWSVKKLHQMVHLSNNWKTTAYLTHLRDILTFRKKKPSDVVASSDDNNNSNNNNQDDEDRKVLFIMGDSHSKNELIPAVAKSRFSQYALSKKTGKPFFRTIVWPLSIKRHYDAVDEYAKLVTDGKVAKWEDKKEGLIWRGAVTGLRNDKKLVRGYPDEGWRIKVVKRYFSDNSTLVDVAFQKGHDTLKAATNYNVNNYVRDSHTSIENQLKFKYLFTIEGNDVATGLKWQLASNSVVFMAKPTCVTYAMEDLLVPFVHYVPLKDDYSNIIEMVRWAQINDARCRWISEQATKFMDRLWIGEDAKRDHELIQRELGEAYHRQFGEAMAMCAPPDDGNSGAPPTPTPPPRPYRPDLTLSVVSSCVPGGGKLGPEFVEASYSNKRSFCDKWNATCVFSDQPPGGDNANKPNLDKWRQIDRTLRASAADWIMWLDCDAAFTNLNVDWRRHLQNYLVDEKVMLVSKDRNGVNSGVLFVPNTMEARRFAMKLEADLRDSEDDDQMVLKKLLIKEPHLRKAVDDNVPQEKINSYIDNEAGHQWGPDEWIAHQVWCPKKEEYKRHFLSILEDVK